MSSVLNAFISWAGLGIPAFLFVITVVVFFHELGHFIVGRLFNTKVEMFSIGFGREVYGWTDSKGTRWKISWLPLGGYVRFAGDADASSRPGDASNVPEEQRHEMLQFKPLAQRALVVAAGPFANFILAIAIFAGVLMFTGKFAEPPTIGAVAPGSAAAAAGLQVNDVILAAGGKPTAKFPDLIDAVVDNAGHTLALKVQRSGRAIDLAATPHREEITDRSGHTHVVGRLGITAKLVPVGPLEALGLGASETWYIIDQTMRYLGGLLAGHESASGLSGPLGIAKVSGDMAQLGFLAVVNLTALLSVSIGLINLFPIPVLDGGHLLYYGFEAVLGRPLGARAQEVGFRLGLALMLSLMLLATFNDLVRFNLF
jgi:regulator of sigma E protease